MNSFEVALQIAGSVALLLFGLSQIRMGMEEAFGMRLKMILGFGTQTGLRAFMTGLWATLGLQSSTATALLAASFVKRALIDGQMAQIVLLGANVGTALTALVVSTGIEAVAPILVLIGYAMHRRNGAIPAGIGSGLIGVGLMLISLALLDDATAPIRNSEALAAFLSMLDNAAPVALVLAAGLAVLCSSSLAAVLVVLSLPMPPALTVVMVLGANLGGALPAVLATANEGIAARRLTVGNLMIRAIGCLIAFPFSGMIAQGLDALPVRQTDLAVEAHVAFNVVLAVLIWPAVKAVTRLVAWMIPDDEAHVSDSSHWLDAALLDTPQLALAGASREVLAIGDMAERMLRQTRSAFGANDISHLAAVGELEKRIDRRQQEVKNYLSRLGNTATETDRRRAINILDYVINLEHVGDIIEKGLAPERIEAPQVLDTLTRQGRLPPVVAVLVPSIDSQTRARELPGNRVFADVLADELLPQVAAHLGVAPDPARTVLAGASYGGLAAATVALSRPDAFGNALSMSGSFWWAPGDADTDGTPWMADQVARRTSPPPVRFFLSAGLFESGRRGTAGILETSRILRDTLRLRGYDVTWRTYAGGHDYLVWRGALADGLIALFGNPETAGSP